MFSRASSEFAVADRFVALRTEKAEVVVRVMEGTFPDYGQIMPKDCPGEASLPVHPAQLYEAVAALVLFAALWWLPRRRFRGEVTVAFFAGYAGWRLFAETLRGDGQAVVLYPSLPTATPQQLVSATVLAAALAALAFAPRWRARPRS